MYGLIAESVAYGGEELELLLLRIMNFIFEKGTIPDELQLGLLTPVYKKKGFKKLQRNHSATNHMQDYRNSC